MPEIVRKVQLWHRRRDNPVPGSTPGADCQARARLPVETLSRAHETLADHLDAGEKPPGLSPVIACA